MTAAVCYLKNALTPHKRELLSVESGSIRSLAPTDWAVPYVAFLDGQPVLRADWELVLEDGQSLAFIDVNAIPQGGGGGGGSNPIQAVLMIAVMVYAPYMATTMYGAMGGTFVAANAMGVVAAMTLGVQMAGMALVGALMPPPQPTSPQTANAIAAASPTYNLQAQGNSARLEAAIPEHFGRLICFPDYAAQPYTEYAGNEQYLYSLLCVGRGHYDLQDVKVEDTDINNFDEVTIETVGPNQQVTLFPTNVISSVEVSGQTLSDTEWVGPFIASAAGKNANFLGFDFVAPKGLYYANDNGSLASRSSSVIVEARAVDINGAAVGDWIVLSGMATYSEWSDWQSTELPLGSSALQEVVATGLGSRRMVRTRTLLNATTPGKQVFTAATTTPQRYSVRYPVTSGRYEVRVKRGEAEDTSTRAGSALVFAGLRAYLTETRDFGDVTLLAVRMRASNNLSSQASRKINVVAARKLPKWDGSTWSVAQDTVATRSIAWAFAYAAKSIGMTDAQLDLPGLLTLDATWAARGDTFNARFDNFLSFWEAITKVLGAGRAKPFMQGGTLRVFRDQAATVPVAMFSQRNIRKDSFSVNYLMPTEDTADAVDVGYFDETTWTPTRVRANLLDGVTPLKPVKVDLFGVTSRDQAYREGMKLAADNRYRRKIITFSAEMEGYLLSYGDLITIQHDMPAWGQGGEIVSWDAGTKTATLSEPLVWSNGTHYIGLRDKEGKTLGPYQVTAGADAYRVIIPSLTNFTPYTGSDYERTHFAFGWADTWSQLARVLSAKPSGSDTVTIECVNEDDNVHTAEVGKITPVRITSQLKSYATASAVLDVSVAPALYNPGALVVSWQPAVGANSYIVEQSSDGVTWTQVGTPTGNSLVVQALYGSDTLIRVAAYGVNKGPWSGTAVVEADATPVPLPPAASVVGGLFSNQLSWVFGDTIQNRIGTEIWFSGTNNRATANRLSVEPYPANTYTHYGLAAGQACYYWLRVSSHVGYSTWFPASDIGGLYGNPSGDPSAVLSQLLGSITFAELSAEVRQPFIDIPQSVEVVSAAVSAADVAQGVTALKVALTDYDLSTRMQFQEAVTNATITTDPVTGQIQLLATAVTTTDVEQRISAVEVTADADHATLTTTVATVATTAADLATAQTQISTMAGQLTTTVSSTYVDSAVAGVKDTLLSTANSALDLAQTEIQAALDIFTQGGELKAAAVNLATAVEQIAANASAIDAEVTHREAIVAVVAQNGAAILQESTVRATDIGVVAKSVTDLTTQMTTTYGSTASAATSAQQASGSSTAAGNSADAAAASATTATTKAGEAAGSAAAAVTSANSASGSSTAAGNSANAAAASATTATTKAGEAAGSAAAAVTSASSASGSSTAAGNSANAAAASATTATTKAGEAAGSAAAAVTSANSASGSSTAAGNSADAAAASAVTANTKAGEASASAGSAASSAITAGGYAATYASNFSTLVARLDTGDYATVKEQSAASADTLTNMSSKWGVQVETMTDGVKAIAGLQLVAGEGTESTVAVMADKFAVYQADGTGGPMFAIGTVGGVATMGFKGSLLLDDSVAADKLNVTALSSVTADLGEITAGKARNAGGSNVVDFNATGSQPFIKVGNNVTIDASGNATFAGVIISRDMVRASGVGDLIYAPWTGGYGELDWVVIDTGIPITSWSLDTPYVAIGGTVAAGEGIKTFTGNESLAEWGVVTELLPWTRWMYGATLKIRVKFYYKNIFCYNTSRYTWKVFKVT
jgi:predicted phage tail protein